MERPVRVNELGLVTPPRRLDCLGESCPVAKKSGSCFVDNHHLYFTRIKFHADPLRKRFREHPFNQIRLPRCQHNSSWHGSIHKRYDGAPVPEVDIMQEFLEEASLLKKLGVVAIESDGLLKGLEDESATSAVNEKRRENWLERQAAVDFLLQRAKVECEIIRPYIHHPTTRQSYTIGAMLLNAA